MKRENREKGFFLKLFWSTFTLSAFTFGGGYVIIGYRLAGSPGALLTILGTVLPPLIILSIISLFYQAFRDSQAVSAVMKGMQAGVAAVIADVVLTMGINVFREKKALPILIMFAVFIASYFFNVNIILIVVLCGLIGVIDALIGEKRRKERGV